MVTAKCVAEFMRHHDRFPNDLRVGQTEIAHDVGTDAIGNIGSVQRVHVGHPAAEAGTAQQVYVVSRQADQGGGIPA